MIVISDTNVLSSLAAGDSFHLLLRLYPRAKLSIPQIVLDELQAGYYVGTAYLQPVLQAIRAHQIHVLLLTAEEELLTFQYPTNLDAGERQAIALAQVRKATLLCNDKNAIRYCKQNGKFCSADYGMSLLEVRNLKTYFATKRGEVRAVDDVSFTLWQGEVLALVGESGCGKSVTALSILRLVSPPGRITGGELLFEGRDLLKLAEREMRAIRGDDIAMIFQDPMTSLNPVYTVGEQIAEAIRLHRKVSKKEAWNQAIEGMRDVAIPAPEVRAKTYPHEMSGGMRQRVMIAMALACDPKLLIADEPTTALDVTIQAQILDLLNDLRERRNLALLLITHDLGVVAETADRVAVMYAGRIVEEAQVKELFRHPRHPYTEGLLRAVPRLDESGEARKRRLQTIEGAVPNPLELPPGCRFAPRCEHAREQCRAGEIDLVKIGEHHLSRCVRVGEIYPR